MSKFKNPSGARYLKALFYEEVGEDKSTVVYTLKRDDHMGFPSLYRLYMEAADPTEYRFAVSNLDSWSHWQMLCECTWFKPIVAEWREEMDIKVRSESLAQIIAFATDKASPSSYQASKYLLDGSWKPAGEKKAGRPTKVAIQQAAHQIASQAQREADDLQRISKAN